MVESVKTFNKIVIGSVINDVVEKNRLAVCTCAKQVSASGKSLFMCSFGFGVCQSFGERVKFRCFSQGYRVAWVCPHLVGMPNEEI